MKRIMAIALIGATLAACGQPEPRGMTALEYQKFVQQVNICIVQTGPEKPSVKDYCQALVSLRNETTVTPTIELGR